MELRLPRGVGSRDHGYAAELDADLEGADEVVLDAGELVGLHPLFAVRLALWIERHRQAGHKIELNEPRDEATRRSFRAFLLGKDIGGVGEALVEDDADVIVRPIRLGELTGQWRDTKDGVEFFERLSREASVQAGLALQFSS